MCMEDVRIGRKTMFEEKQFTLPNAAYTEILPASPNRIGIIFGTPSSSTVVVTTNPTATTPDGLRIGTNGSPFGITVQEFGQAVCAAWFAKAAAGSPTFTVVQALLADQ